MAPGPPPAVAVAARADASEADKDFYAGKLTACQYFFRYELPKIHTQCALLSRLDDTTLNARAETL